MAIAFDHPSNAAINDKKSDQRLEIIERKLKKEREQKRSLDQKQEKLNNDLNHLSRIIVESAKSIQQYETEATRLEARLRQLRKKEASSHVRLKQSRKQTSRVLMALGRMARNPPEAMIVQPATPTQTVRSAILLRAAVPEIERRALRLRGQLNELTAAQEAVSQRHHRLKDVMASLRSEQKHMNALMVQKEKIRRKTQTKSARLSKRVAALALEATSLRELMDKLKRVPKQKIRRRDNTVKKPGYKPGRKITHKNSVRKSIRRSITKSRGTLLRPAVGRIINRYGRPSRAGLRRKGLTIETRPGAQVVAPFRGDVVFADQFRGYGRLLIIDHGEGYHTLLAGFARIDVTVGQSIVAGEPVGVMERMRDKNSVLYVEFRRKGQPINPLPWLTTQNIKVNK